MNDEPNLGNDLAHDLAFCAALGDDQMAQAFYRVFQNRDFVRIADLGSGLN